MGFPIPLPSCRCAASEVKPASCRRCGVQPSPISSGLLVMGSDGTLGGSVSLSASTRLDAPAVRVGGGPDARTARLLEAVKVARDAVHRESARRGQPPKGHRPDPEAPPRRRPHRKPPGLNAPPLPPCKQVANPGPGAVYEKGRPPAPCFAPAVLPSPAHPGPHPIAFRDVDEPALGIEDIHGQFPLRGRLYFPAVHISAKSAGGAQGLPLVVLAHGNHGPGWIKADLGHPDDCEVYGDCFSKEREAPPGFVPFPSHLGFEYMQSALASHGIVSFSVNFNRIDVHPGTASNWVHRRYKLILAAIDHVASLAGVDGPLRNMVDLTRLGLIGHSRGGGAVVDAAEAIRVKSMGSRRVRAVAVVAPHAERSGADGPSLRSDYAFLSVFGTEDEDFPSGREESLGAVWYDLKAPTPLKCQVHLRGGNHKSFNSFWSYAWRFSEGGNAPRTPSMPSDTEHQRTLAAFGCAFFRFCLLDTRDQLDWLIGGKVPDDVAPARVELSFQVDASSAITIDDFEDPEGIGTNALGGENTAAAELADEFVLTGWWPRGFGPAYGDDSGVYLNTREPDDRPGTARGGESPVDGFTKGLVLRGGSFRMAIPDLANVTGAELWLRAALLPEATLQRRCFGYRDPGPPDFEVGLEDASGTIAWCSALRVGGVQEAHRRQRAGEDDHASYRRRALLKTLRFPNACFSGRGVSIDLERVRAVIVRCRSSFGAWAFDNIQIVRPGRARGGRPGFGG